MLYVMMQTLFAENMQASAMLYLVLKERKNLQQSQMPCTATVLVASERPCPILPIGWQLLISWMISAVSPALGNE